MLGLDLATAIGQTPNKTNGVGVKEGCAYQDQSQGKGKGEMAHYELAPTDEVRPRLTRLTR